MSGAQPVLIPEHDDEAATANAWGDAGAGRIALWIGIHSIDLRGIDDILCTRVLGSEPFFAPAVDITRAVQCAAPSGRQATLPGEVAGMRGARAIRLCRPADKAYEPICHQLACTI